MMLCDHIWYICCACPWRNCPCVSFFLQGLVLEPYRLSLVSLVSCFLPTVFSRTNKFISWGPCIPSLICWNFKRLSQIYMLQVRYQKSVPTFHPHLFHISSWYSWTSNLSYIVHWTIFQGHGLCPLSCNCSICLSLHFKSLASHLEPDTWAWLNSMLHVNFH